MKKRKRTKGVNIFHQKSSKFEHYSAGPQGGTGGHDWFLTVETLQVLLSLLTPHPVLRILMKYLFHIYSG